MKVGLNHLAVFAFFLGLTLLLTYPLILNLRSGVRVPQDPLLNSWILSWDIRELTHLDFRNFFNANIFYPYKRTLAYSEHLFPQSLIALPVKLISGNPILAYNFVLIFAIVTAGFSMYLLTSYLTKNAFSSIVAGIIFAFSPFMFTHLIHLQVISAGGIPLSFLFLHRYFEGERFKDLLLLTFFYIVQILANGYYAAYLSLFLCLAFLYFFTTKKKFGDRRLWTRLGLCATIVLTLAGPFFYQYLQVRREMGFSRNLGPSAPSAVISSYIATPSFNRLYGKLTEFPRGPGLELFPGGTAFILATIGITLLLITGSKKTPPQSKKKYSKLILFLKMLNNLLIIIWSLVIVLTVALNGFKISLGGPIKLQSHSFGKPLLTLLGFLFLRALLAVMFGNKSAKFRIPGRETLLVYGGIFLLAFLFSFGLKGPYLLLYKYVPGFDGLRATSRFHIFVMFSLAVFAAYGVSYLLRRLKAGPRRLLQFLVPALILAEYFSVPIPLTKVPVKKEIPAVYQWLSEQKDADISLLELPLPGPRERPGRIECPRVYYSAYHWKKTVNGYSGYYSPLYNELRGRWEKLPEEEDIRDLKPLGLKYIILHTGLYGEKRREQILFRFSRFGEALRLIKKFGDDCVYEILYEPGERERAHPPAKFESVSLKGCAVKANVHGAGAKLAVDGLLETRWNCGPQKNGQYFEVDLARPQPISGVSLKLGKYVAGYPRGYIVQVSADGISWTEVAREDRTRLPLERFLKPKDVSLDILFAPVGTRFIRIMNTGEDPNHKWSICELAVLK